MKNTSFKYLRKQHKYFLCKQINFKYFVILLWCFWWAQDSRRWRAWHLLSSWHSVPLFHHIHLVINTHTQVQTKHRDKWHSQTPLHLPSHVTSCLWMRDCGRKAEVLTASRAALLSVCHSHACAGTTTNKSHTRIDWILCILLFVHYRNFQWHCKHHLTDIQEWTGNRLALCRDIICTGVCLMFGWVIIG